MSWFRFTSVGNLLRPSRPTRVAWPTRFCDVRAVEFVDGGDVSLQKKREAALRLSAAGKQAAAMEERTF